MKTKEELDTIKTEYEDVKEKLAELTDEELEQVTGGGQPPFIQNDPGREVYKGMGITHAFMEQDE